MKIDHQHVMAALVLAVGVLAIGGGLYLLGIVGFTLKVLVAIAALAIGWRLVR